MASTSLPKKSIPAKSRVSTKKKRVPLVHIQHPVLQHLSAGLLCVVALCVGISIYALSASCYLTLTQEHYVADGMPTSDQQAIASCPAIFTTQTAKAYGSESEKNFGPLQQPSRSYKYNDQADPTCGITQSRCGAYGYEDNDCDGYCGRGGKQSGILEYIEGAPVCGDLYLTVDIVIAGKTYYKGYRYPYEVLLWGDCNDADPSYKANRVTYTHCGIGGMWNCTNGEWTCKGDTSAGGNNGGGGGGGGTIDIVGSAYMFDGTPVQNVKVTAYSRSFAGVGQQIGSTITKVTNQAGTYAFLDVRRGEAYILWAEKNDGIALDYVSVADSQIIYRYLAGKITLSPEEMRAADVNGDKQVNQADIDLITKLGNGNISHFPVQGLWKMFPKNTTSGIVNPSTLRVSYQGLVDDTTLDFLAVKLGDVSGAGSNIADEGGDTNLKGGTAGNGGIGETLPPQEGTLPPENGQPEEGNLPPQEGTLPPQEGTLPPENTLPPQQGQQPTNPFPQEPIIDDPDQETQPQEPEAPIYTMPVIDDNQYEAAVEPTVDQTAPAQNTYPAIPTAPVYTPTPYNPFVWYYGTPSFTISPRPVYTQPTTAPTYAPTRQPQPTQPNVQPRPTTPTFYPTVSR